MNRIIGLLFFVFFTYTANAQYNTPIRNKVTLGKQTTADGLVWRGVNNDTALITPLNDTSVYIILDTINNKFWNYNRATNVWSLAGGQDIDTTNLIATKYNLGFKLNISDTTSIAYVNTYGTQTVNGAKTFTTAPTFSTALSGSSGGTGITTFGAANRIPYASSTTALTTNSNLLYDGTRLRVNQVAIGDTSSNTVGITNLLSLSGGSGAGFTLKSSYDSPILRSFTFLVNALGNAGFWNNNLSTYAYFINNSDNFVGIGQTNPTARLHVKGSGVATGEAFKIENSGNTNLLTVLDNGAATFSSSVTANSLSLTTPLSVANGGTGATTFTAGRVLFGNGTSAINTNSNFRYEGDILYIPNAIFNGTTNYGYTFAARNASATGNVGIFLRGTQDAEINLPTTFGYPYINIGGQENKINAIQTIGFGFTNGTGGYISPAEIGYQTTSVSGYTQGDLVFATRNSTSNVAPTEKMRITSSGNLGLGVTPSAWGSTYTAFQIGTATSLFNINAGVGYTYLINNAYLNSSSQAVYINTGYATNYAQLVGEHRWSIAPSGTAGNTFTFTQAMTLGANSGLSIGTTTAAPANGLLVAGAATFSSTATATKFIPTDSIQSNGGMYKINSTTLGLNVDNETPFRITNSGNWGIYNDNPQNLLSAFSSSARGGVISNPYPILMFNEIGNSKFVFGLDANEGYLWGLQNVKLIIATNSTEKMRVNTDGEVWIGYTTDQGAYRLQVNGQIFATNATIATSDEKFKENIIPLSKGLEIVNKLKPVTFNFITDTKNNFSEYEEVGFIAQDVERALSTESFSKSIVKQSDDSDPNSTMGLASQNLIPILVKAIQEQQAQIETLKQEIINLKNK